MGPGIEPPTSRMAGKRSATTLPSPSYHGYTQCKNQQQLQQAKLELCLINTGIYTINLEDRNVFNIQQTCAISFSKSY